MGFYPSSEYVCMLTDSATGEGSKPISLWVRVIKKKSAFPSRWEIAIEGKADFRPWIVHGQIQ